MAARGPLVKLAEAAEVRIVTAEIFAPAADALLVAQHPPKLSAHLLTFLALLNVRNLARINNMDAVSTREKKGGG
jgi:hypothetical protein